MEAFPNSEWRQERRFNRKGVVMNIHRILLDCLTVSSSTCLFGIHLVGNVRYETETD